MSKSIIEERLLVVYINDDIVGQLKEHNGLWAFEYEPDWINQPGSFPLTPSLTLQQEPHIDTGTQRKPPSACFAGHCLIFWSEMVMLTSKT
ncbi:MAG: HipA N-terminal domain-containing protein [Idiomarina sp.]|nr:HipA N-terminal domain-containing protein [Idiomarina sp.]